MQIEAGSGLTGQDLDDMNTKMIDGVVLRTNMERGTNPLCDAVKAWQ